MHNKVDLAALAVLGWLVGLKKMWIAHGFGSIIRTWHDRDMLRMRCMNKVSEKGPTSK